MAGDDHAIADPHARLDAGVEQFEPVLGGEIRQDPRQDQCLRGKRRRVGLACGLLQPVDQCGERRGALLEVHHAEIVAVEEPAAAGGRADQHVARGREIKAAKIGGGGRRVGARDGRRPVANQPAQHRRLTERHDLLAKARSIHVAPFADGLWGRKYHRGADSGAVRRRPPALWPIAGNRARGDSPCARPARCGAMRCRHRAAARSPGYGRGCPRRSPSRAAS